MKSLNAFQFYVVCTYNLSQSGDTLANCFLKDWMNYLFTACKNLLLEGYCRGPGLSLPWAFSRVLFPCTPSLLSCLFYCPVQNKAMFSATCC